MSEEKKTLPTISDLTADVNTAFKSDQLNLLLNQPPPQKWIKKHPFIKDKKGNLTHSYLPIDKVEFMLKKIFKQYRVEITDQGSAFNGVWVRVRVHYLNPSNNEWSFHDGIGAMQLQVKSGQSPADLASINNGALSMAFPIAKTLAIKDACDHFGDLFGANLNRKDVQPFTEDESLKDELLERTEELIDNCKTVEELEALKKEVPMFYKDLVQAAIDHKKNA
jgi:hypothetical protein